MGKASINVFNSNYEIQKKTHVSVNNSTCSLTASPA